MNQEESIKELYDYADKFINLANELSKKNNSGIVGTALRYASARYSAFELSVVAREKMEEERENFKKNILKDYDQMLEENIKAYIHYLSQQKNNQ